MGVLAAGAGVVFLVLLALSGRPPRYRFWRGTPEGTRDEVQREHLELFFPPAQDDEEEDDS